LNSNRMERAIMIYSESLKGVTWNIITESGSGLIKNFFC
jgi:hypothetical protein